jgi:hypothetical protein
MKVKFLAAIAALLLFASSQAHALTYSTYTLNQNNVGLEGGPWATVTLTDAETYNGHAAIKITVAPLEGAFSGISTDFGLKTFAFNAAPEVGNFSELVTSELTGWALDFTAPGSNGSGKSGGSGSSSEFGKFELSYNGKPRQNPLEFYLYSLDPDTVLKPGYFAIAGDNGYFFAAHITDFSMYDDKETLVDSAWFGSDGTPVPEPGTFALLGAGLLGLVFYKRRTGN